MKRCKMRKGNGMLLREYLKEWTKEDLLNEARSYELKNCSRLKKDDLIDRILRKQVVVIGFCAGFQAITVNSILRLDKMCRIKATLNIDCIVANLVQRDRFRNSKRVSNNDFE